MRAGQALVVLGRNGAGKSTLLRTLAGLALPTEGSLEYPEGDLRHLIGMSSLEGALYPHLSAREHLEFVARARGCEPRTDELLDEVGLAHAGEMPTNRFSTGMKARLRLAIAVQHRPPILLLDEPGAGLDAAGRGLTEAICARQRTCGVLVIATNDPGERRFATHELDLGE